MAERYTKINGKQILADSVEPSDLKSTNAEVDNYVPSYDLATGKFTWISVPTTLQGAFDGGQTITVADNDNQKFVYTNNDVTNNPNCVEIINAGTNHLLYLKQDGVLAAVKYGLYVYSNAVQVNSPLAYFKQDNASSTKGCSELINDGSGDALTVRNHGIGSGLYVYQNSNASSGAVNIYQSAAGTYHGLYVQQYGVHTAGYRTAAFVSNIAQTNANTSVLYVSQTTGSTKPMAELINHGTGYGIWLRQIGNGWGILADNSGTQPAIIIGGIGNKGLYIYEEAAAGVDIASVGQIWVKNDTPNKLMFTDDAGIDHEIAFV